MLTFNYSKLPFYLECKSNNYYQGCENNKISFLMHQRMYIFYALKYALFTLIKNKRYVNKQFTGVNIMKSINTHFIY